MFASRRISILLACAALAAVSLTHVATDRWREAFDRIDRMAFRVRAAIVSLGRWLVEPLRRMVNDVRAWVLLQVQHTQLAITAHRAFAVPRSRPVVFPRWRMCPSA